MPSVLFTPLPSSPQVHGSRIDTCTTLRKAIAAMDSPPQVFVTASGIGIYPPHISREYSEDSQLIGQGSYLAELARDWEASAQLPPGTAARNVYCRLGVVLGKVGLETSKLDVVCPLTLPIHCGCLSALCNWCLGRRGLSAGAAAVLAGAGRAAGVGPAAHALDSH